MAKLSMELIKGSVSTLIHVVDASAIDGDCSKKDCQQLICS